MPARVQVIVEAKDATSGVFRALTSQLGAFGGLIEEVTAKNVNWGNVAQMATGMVVDGLKSTIAATTQYAREVRDLSLASGQSAEQSSRMLQVLDDYQLTAEDAKAATRALTKEGLAPTIDTIASLSGEFLKLNSVEERNAFVQQNLGRAGQEWLNLLSQGPDKIMAMNDAVSENLVLTDDQVQATEDYRLAVDQLGETFEGLKVAIGNQLIPGLTDYLGVLNDDIRAMELMDEQGLNWFTATREQTDAIYAQIAAENVAVEAKKASTQATLESTQSKEEERRQTELFNSELGELKNILAGDLGKAQDEYNAKIAEYKKQLEGARTEKEKDVINANIAAETSAYNERAVAIAFNIQQEALLNSQLPPETKIGMITALGQAYGMYDQETANAINTTQGWITRLQEGTLTEEAAIQHMKGMALGLRESGKAATESTAPIDNFNSQVYHTGARASEASEMLGDFGEAAGSMGETVSTEAVGPVSALKSGFNQLPPTGSSWEYYFNIVTRGSIPKFSMSGVGLGGSTDYNCFVEDTQVQLSDTVKAIQDVRVGDEVVAYDTQTGQYISSPVVRVFHHTADEMQDRYYLLINDIGVTPDHLMYINGEWTPAGEAKVGDELLGLNGKTVTIARIRKVYRRVPTYNLHIEHRVHNYFANGVLVHNAKQQGGEVYAGQPTWVGEAGREPFFPAQDGRILGHSEALHAMSLGGGGGARYTFYGPVTLQIAEDSAAGIMGVR